MVDLEDWKMKKLVANQQNRVKAFHAITDDEYHRIDMMHLRYGLLDALTGYRQIKCYDDEDHEAIRAVYARVQNVNIGYEACALNFWQLISSERRPLVLPFGTFRV